MGVAWSKFQSTPTCDVAVKCASPSEIGLAAGSAGAGVGTFFAFFVAAVATICLSFWVMYSQWSTSRDPNLIHLNKESQRILRRDHLKRNNVREQVIISFSDQQLVTGLAMAITVRFFSSCDAPVSAYHYDMICYLMLVSIVTHLCSIVAVDQYFYPFSHSTRATINRCGFLLLRCIGITASIILTALILFDRNMKTFPVIPPTSTNDTSKLLLRPAACFFVGADEVSKVVDDIPESLSGWQGKDWTHGLLQFVVFVLAIMIALPTAIVHSLQRGFCGPTPPVRLLFILRFAVVLAGLGVVVWTFVLSYQLREFMQSSGWLGEFIGAERDWTFSQIISVLILAYAPITAFNVATDHYDARHEMSGHASEMQVLSALNHDYTALKTAD